MYLLYTNMSILTSLSIKDEHKKEYNSMRNWLKQKNISMGDYLIEKYSQEFQQAIQHLTNN